jgi:hypothetical protein
MSHCSSWMAMKYILKCHEQYKGNIKNTVAHYFMTKKTLWEKTNWTKSQQVTMIIVVKKNQSENTSIFSPLCAKLKTSQNKIFCKFYNNKTCGKHKK